MCLHTHKGLQRVLRKRLPHIDRWRRVTVYRWDSKRLPWFIDRPEKGFYYIVWSGNKRGNIHDDEVVQRPLDNIDYWYNKNNERLKRKTKIHK